MRLDSPNRHPPSLVSTADGGMAFLSHGLSLEDVLTGRVAGRLSMLDASRPQGRNMQIPVWKTSIFNAVVFRTPKLKG